jgi:hypothetical protein
MNANAFRQFYDYHFAENRKIWDWYVTDLTHAQFTQAVDYSHEHRELTSENSVLSVISVVSFLCTIPPSALNRS